MIDVKQAIPCRQCLTAMANWKTGEPKPACLATDTASTGCAGCKDSAKPCTAPTGALRSRGIELAWMLTSDAVSSGAIKSAQNTVKVLLNTQKDAESARNSLFAEDDSKDLPLATSRKRTSGGLPVKKGESLDAETGASREERRVIALERIAASLEKLVAHTTAIPSFPDTLNTVHRDALEKAGKEADEVSNETAKEGPAQKKIKIFFKTTRDTSDNRGFLGKWWD
ncbi:hypothetical protein GGS21DRAFT_384722 [Xylaria nigripes]|nr:hypothetical protein GGS21DRAFT_384722 [Xylaria nigripes]